MDMIQILPYVTPILTFIFGTALVWDITRRKKFAEVKRMEAENITMYAAEWKELYEKKEHKVMELDAKIDRLYEQIESLRGDVRSLKENSAELQIENIKLENFVCYDTNCKVRQREEKKNCPIHKNQN